MKTFGLLLFLSSVIVSTPLLANCEEALHTAMGKTSTEAIETARFTMPSDYLDNSTCTSPIIQCDLGFKFSEDGEFCVNEHNEFGFVTATISTKTSLRIGL